MKKCLFVLFITLRPALAMAQLPEPTPCILVQCDTPYFDFGNSTTSVDIRWKVKNISKFAVRLPVVVNVYVDVNIGNRWGAEEWLTPGKTVNVLFHIPYGDGRINFHKSGYIEIYGANNTLQKIPAEVKGHFVPREPDTVHGNILYRNR